MIIVYKIKAMSGFKIVCYSYITSRSHEPEGTKRPRASDCNIPTGRDVTGLSPVGYYGLRHTVRLLWSLVGNCFASYCNKVCVAVNAASATASWLLDSVWLFQQVAEYTISSSCWVRSGFFFSASGCEYSLSGSY